MLLEVFEGQGAFIPAGGRTLDTWGAEWELTELGADGCPNDPDSLRIKAEALAKVANPDTAELEREAAQRGAMEVRVRGVIA